MGAKHWKRRFPQETQRSRKRGRVLGKLGKSCGKGLGGLGRGMGSVPVSPNERTTFAVGER